MQKAAFNKNALFTSKLGLILRKTLVTCYIWSIALYGAETWTLRKVDQKYLEGWRRSGWTDRVKNEVLQSRRSEISYIQ
jgi:hypothetical protein